MSKDVSSKITFKSYNQRKQWLLPPSLEELVPVGHLVRVVSKTVDELNIEKVFAKYNKRGGASRYHPVMLLKALIYCYLTGSYRGRSEKLIHSMNYQLNFAAGLLNFPV